MQRLPGRVQTQISLSADLTFMLFLPSTILTIRCSVTPGPSDLVQIMSVFSLNSELTLPPPVPCRTAVTFRKQIMETFDGTLGRAKIIFRLFVCFPIDNLNGARR